MTSRPIGPVLAALDGPHRAVLVELFTRMRSDSGFRNDLQFLSPATTGHPRGDGDNRAARRAAGVSQPTLVIATRNDAAVAFEHAQALTKAIAHARLITSSADSHFIWFGADYPAIAATITEFLTAPPGQPPRP